MAFDFDQFFQQRFQENQNEIARLQQQTKPQGGVLNQIDPTWLALAQGFLAPTKTGGFGESLSNAAGQLQGPLAQMKQQQMSAQDKIDKIKETQARLALDYYKAQNRGDDDALSLYRDLRNEQMIDRLYQPDLRRIDKDIESNKKIVHPDNYLASDEDKAKAKAEIDRLNAQRSEIESKIEDAKAKRGLTGRQSTAAQPVQSAQPQQSSQPQDIKKHPDVQTAIKMYKDRKGSTDPARLPMIRKQIIERLNQNGINADESIFAD